MKRSIWTRIIAFVLIFSLLPMNVSAASIYGNSRGSKWGWSWDWLWDLIPGFGSNEPVEETQPVETQPAETEPVETEAPTEATDPATDSSADLVLVEDETTVENGEMLRATTYMLSSSDSAPADNAGIALMSTRDVAANAEAGTVVKYFGVTLYDYDTDTINAATDALDSDLTVREGLYFSGGAPSYTKQTGNVEDAAFTVEDDQVIIADGAYLLYCTDTSYYVTDTVNSGSYWGTTVLNGTSADAYSSASLWTFTRQDDGSYTIQNASGAYLTITGRNIAATTTDENTVTLTPAATGFIIYDDSGSNYGYLNSLGGTYYGTGYFGGYTSGSNFTIHNLIDAEDKIISGYEAWNRWDKASGNNNNGQKTYTGLVASELDVNKDIVFTVPEGGIFNSDATVKNIYTEVQMPFVYENGVYTFDASVNGVYFHEDEEQGSSGTAASGARLYFNEGNTQSNGTRYADVPEGEVGTVWMPFNDATEIGSEANCNYHFGMRTTIPFTMTTNGRMNQNDDTSDAITFSFSGDDDVWVFIDGKLVIDLGGIHNRLDATIDFANNTVVYSESNALSTETGSYNDSSFALTQTLFENLIPQDRATFAAADSHELTIFYLERGMGSSNCKIQFNLPMKDTVTVTKHATQSWTDDGSEEGTVSNLTANEQAIVNNIDFGFTLYKSTDGGETYEKVANTNFSLLNENGQVLEVRSTDANGHFYLKNGQSARFVTAFTNDENNNGVTYYVVEDNVSALGFVTPDFNFDGTAARGFNANGTAYTSANLIPEQILDTNATENKSHAVTVYGSDESEDSVVFICENYIDAKLPNPSALPAEDKIVIDYGLAVNINVLGNDNYRGDSIEIIGVYGSDAELLDAAKTTVYTELNVNEIVNNPDSVPAFGSVTVNDDNTLTYQLTEQLSGVEELHYVIKVTGATTNSAGTTTTAYTYGIATVYIIPATTMYYEENFSNMIDYVGSNWGAAPAVDNSITQEPGVVGTVGDSPYGSDRVYMDDSNDSNGTSRYANTASSAVKFSYTFTGTGTSFFARTTKNSGFMKIVVTDANNVNVHSSYRDTVYQNEGTLYNIPVFTYIADSYGTYTVTVTVLKGTTANGYGTEFWLDGVRVYKPLDPDLLYAAEGVDQPENYSVAASAYATDGEANMANVTLRDKILTEADFMVGEDGELVVDDLGNPIPVWTEGGNFVLFTDSDGAMDTAEEYESFGPKEEVYLNNGQSVTFSLYDWDPNTNNNKIYLGIKAPMGNGTVTIGTTQLPINNSVDCYYDISSYGTITTDSDGIMTITFTITAGEGSLISLTNIKVSGSFEFTIIAGTDNEVENEEEDIDAQNEEESVLNENGEDVVDGAEEEVPAEENPSEDVVSDEPTGESAEQTQED